jgi:hypothetical protein
MPANRPMQPDTGKLHKKINLLRKELNHKSFHRLSHLSISVPPNDYRMTINMQTLFKA